jgi:hypothetical protein
MKAISDAILYYWALEDEHSHGVVENVHIFLCANYEMKGHFVFIHRDRLSCRLDSRVHNTNHFHSFCII